MLLACTESCFKLTLIFQLRNMNIAAVLAAFRDEEQSWYTTPQARHGITVRQKNCCISCVKPEVLGLLITAEAAVMHRFPRFCVVLPSVRIE